MKKEIIELSEKKLNEAMITHDIHTLDQLLDDQVVFINHFGNILKKTDDIQSHKNNDFTITSIDVLENNITLFENVAISVSHTVIHAIFGDNSQTDNLIYNRVWQKQNDGSIKIISATVTAI